LPPATPVVSISSGEAVGAAAAGDTGRNIASMSKLIRMDHTGHSTLAEWTEDNPEACEAAIREFRRELDEGCIGMVSDGPGKATQVRELPLDADLVILRRPIAGG